MKTIKTIEEIPTTAHWVLLKNRKINIPADQHSIDNPGHGYGASVEEVINYTYFDNETELKKWLETNGQYSNFKFTCYWVVPKSINFTSTVTITDNETK